MFSLKKKLNNLINKRINEISINYFYLNFALFAILTIIGSIIFYKKLVFIYPYIIDESGNIVYSNFQFEYGELLSNLIHYNSYSSEMIIMGKSIEFNMNRLPFLPFIVFIANIFSSKLVFLIIFKNLIFFSIIFLTVYKFSKEKNYKIFNMLILLLIFFYNPFNLKIITNFVYADFIIAVLMPILFLITISKFRFKYYYLGIILFLLYLTKSNMFIICVTLAIYFLLIEKKKLPILLVLISIIAWGSFGLIKTNKFAFGSSSMSTNSHGLSLSLNKDFHKYYPLISVDYIKHCKLNDIDDNCLNIPDKIDNEWDYYNYYKLQNSEYLKNNWKIFLSDMMLKLRTIFFNYYEDGQIYEENKEVKKKFIFSVFINKAVLLFSLFICIKSIFTNFSIREKKIEIIYLIILFSSLPVFLIGWALSRHLVYLFFISHLYIFIKYGSKKYP